MTDENKKLKENVKLTRAAMGAGNQVAQNVGMIDANTAQNIAKLAGNPGAFGASVVTGAVAVKGAVVAGAVVAAPVVVPIAIATGVCAAGYGLYKWITD